MIVTSIVGIVASPFAEEHASAWESCYFNRFRGNTYYGYVSTNVNDSWNDAARSSFTQWSERGGSSLFVGAVTNWPPSAVDQPLEMMMRDFVSAGYDDSSPGRAGASSYRPSPNHELARVYMNSNWKWRTDGQFDQSGREADFRTVGTHEVGHTLGFDHPFASCGNGMSDVERASVMNPTFTRKWYLTSNDVSGVADLY